MNAQTHNWIESARLYASEFAGNLDMTAIDGEEDVMRVAKEQVVLSLEQAEYQDGVNLDDVREYGLDEVFAAAIRARLNSKTITVTALNTNFSEISTGEIETTLDAFIAKFDLRFNADGTYSAEWGNGEGSDDFEILS